jgi:acyl carrier protein
MTNDAIQNQIAQVLSHKVQVEAPSVDTDLMVSGLLDSLTLVKLIVALEEEFGIGLPLDEIDLDDFRTIARIAAFVAHATSADRPETG